MTMHEGRPIPPHIAEQAAAAAAETWAQADRRTARGARSYKTPQTLLPEIHQSLLAAYRQACEEARHRYEHGTPRSEWVNDRGRWATCEHLRCGGPAPTHWFVGVPETFLCSTCWEHGSPLIDECGRCGRPDDNLTHIGINDVHSFVTLHAAVCDECYPQGADAPAVR